MLLTNSGAHPIALSLQITWATTRPRPDASPEAPYSERRRLRTYFTHVLLHRRFRPGFHRKDNQILQYKASSISRKSAPSSRFQPATKAPLRHATFRPRATAAFLVHIARFSRGHHHHQCPRPLTSILISASTASTHSLDNATTHALLLDVFALDRHRRVCPNLISPLPHLLIAGPASAAHSSSRW